MALRGACLAIAIAVAVAFGVCATRAAAQETLCSLQVQEAGEPRHPGIVNIYFENDVFAGTDRDYTSGVKLSWVSANLHDYTTDPCLPAPIRSLNGLFEGLHTGKFETRNMVVALGQAIYTPVSRRRTDLIKDDRPYAGWLYLGLGYNARNRERLETVEVNIGVVGPSALAKQTQDFIHNLRGIEHFQGWNNQLKDEPGLQLVYERKYRYELRGVPRWLPADVIPHWGASLGNVATYANLGFELRAGSSLPEDFGSSPIRPAGDNNAPLASSEGSRRQAYGLHAFVSTDARAVLHDIFLDGNTFTHSHSVEKRPFVADVALGVVWRWGGGKFAFGRYWRTREFVGQQRPQRFGSVTLSVEY